MRVSVVVPVHDPGRWIDDLLASLRSQTLDPAEFEVVLVDDGSTDGTSDLLDRVAAGDSRFRVIHTPNSGWPGRPRNLGIDAARGDYVFLADHDDRLAPDALERITDFALTHGADVVAGRVVGVGRSAPKRIFERTVVDAQADLPLLMTSLTPQKLYRRAFLDEAGIRFPEGRRRLEDHLFVTKAYLRAARVGIYADSPVYYFVLRDDGGNASRRPVEWPAYFANAGESIAVVDAEAPDEATRVGLRARWLRTEAIGRLRGRRLIGREDRSALLVAARDFVRRHYPPEEADLLPTAERLIGRLLLESREVDVLAFARWEASLRTTTTVEAAELDTAALRARIRVEARAALPLPGPLRDLPAGLPSAAEIEDLAGLPSGAAFGFAVRIEDGRTVTARVEQRIEHGVLLASVLLPLADLPEPPEGVWRLRGSLRGVGLTVVEALVADPGRGSAVARGPVRIGRLRFALGTLRDRGVVLRVERIGPVPALRRAAVRARRAAGRLRRALRRRSGH